MARGSRRLAAPPERARGLRAPRQSPHQDLDIPGVYRDMLRHDAPAVPHNSRPPKKRRVASASEQSEYAPADQEPRLGVPTAATEDPAPSNHPVQTVFESSDDSDEESFDWEDVEIGGGVADDAEIQPGESLTIVIGDQHGNSPRVRRKGQKPPTQAEKKLRLDVHKIHITCLLYHVFLRNHWCNDPQLQVGS